MWASKGLTMSKTPCQRFLKWTKTAWPVRKTVVSLSDQQSRTFQRLVLILTISETFALGILYAMRSFGPQEAAAYAIGQVLFVYAFGYLFKLCDRTGCLVILLVMLGTLQVRVRAIRNSHASYFNSKYKFQVA